MSIDERVELVKRNSEELVSEDELRKLLSEKETPTAYIGFEPSGIVHMGWVLVAQKIRDLTEAGFKVTIFWADWHAYINDKLGGDLENIRACARYMEDCFKALGVPEDKVEFRYASEVLSNIEYWEMVIKVAKVTNLARVKRAMTIMGRGQDEAEVDTSKVFYPILQATDIFCMGQDLAYAGLDQRRAHMLARDAADKLGWKKPIALHTPLLPGLKGGVRMDATSEKVDPRDRDTFDFKMSKSSPEGSIFIHDDRDAIAKKMKKAFCPPEKELESENPVLMMCRYILFPRNGRIDIDRPEKYGGPVSYGSYEELTEAYFGGSLSPVDLKSGVTDGMAKTLQPVADYFAKKPENYERIQEIVAGLKKLR
ncbi:MAG: tyrosine--tRNA ligase [Candidatus Methanomethylophilaceae archaeon]|nr:tyrosine--tRNA ligase [Candidatus Methanomethylophilaceae archaeon]